MVCELKLAYYNTFFGSPEGRVVLQDMRFAAYNYYRDDDGKVTPENGHAQCTLDSFMELIKFKAGICTSDDEVAVIAAEAGVANKNLSSDEPKEEKEDLLKK